MTASIWKPNGFSPEVRPLYFFEYTATPGQTVFSIAPYTVIQPDQIKVYVAGKIQEMDEFSVVGTSVTLSMGAIAGTFVRIEIYQSIIALPEIAFPDDAGKAGYFLQTDGSGNRTWHPINSAFPAPWVQVDVFGAVGDGVADDTAAIQLALDSSLYVVFGDYTKNYKVTGTLVPRDYTQIHGGGARIFQASRQTPLFNVSNTIGCHISGLRLFGYQAEDVNAGNFQVGVPYTIRTPGSTNFVALGAADNVVGTWFIATGAGSGTGVASTFYNRPISQDIGIRADNASDLVVCDNEFYGFNYSSLMVTLGGTNIRFENNKVEGPGAATLTTNFRNCNGVTVVNTDGVHISGNTFSETSQGVYVGQQSTQVVVAGNNIKNTLVEHGMYIDAGVAGLTVVGNTVKNTALIGIKVQWYDAISDIPLDTVIANNTIEDAGGDGIIVLNAATTQVAALTSVTQANPGVFSTAANHGLVVGDVINITGVTGMTPVNTLYYINSVPTSTSFTVKVNGVPLSTVGFPAYVSGGSVAKPVFGRAFTITGNTIRNVAQDAIGGRYLNNCVIANNAVEAVARYGIYLIYTRNTDVNNNILKDIQFSGIYCLAPTDQCSICDNTLINAGAAGNDTNGNSTGIVLEGDGGVEVAQNTIRGEETQTKMQYGIFLVAGDKRRYSIRDNTVIWAQDAGVRVHADNAAPLLLLEGNTSSTGLGEDVYVNLPASGKGTPFPKYYGAGIPVSGTWRQGSVIEYLFPAPGGYVGAVCVASGTPGTWRQYGRVLAGLNTNPDIYVPLQEGSTTDGLPITSSAPLGGFAVGSANLTSGGPLFIVTQAATNSTVTSRVFWFLQLPDFYVAGTDITVIVTARTRATSGGPNITTRTIRPAFYKAAGDGSTGSEVTTSALTLTGSPAEHTFNLAGATLNPHDIIWLGLVGVITETGGAGAVVQDIFSVRYRLA